jgi:probable rRNA maturation factor
VSAALNELQVDVAKAVGAPITPARIREVLRTAAAEPEVAAAIAQLAGEHAPELGVRITGDRELHRLNREFLSEDHPTDVLSFPSGVAGETGYLGDIAISWPAVLRQSEQFAHPPETEALLLCMHGLLHVLGWDHADAAQENKMTRLTLACLARSGIRPARGRLPASYT